jgi:hypothetical protein
MLFSHKANTWPARVTLYYHLIDMNENNGLGKVISKNQPFFDQGYVGFAECLAAIKHANGRDWWLIASGQYGNPNGVDIDSVFILKTLVNYETGMLQLNVQIINEIPFIVSSAASIAVNHDATKIAFGCASYVNEVYVCSFDRCSGWVSNIISLKPSIAPFVTLNSNDKVYSCCFAPHSNILYISSFKRVFQFDTDVSDINASMKLIYTNNAFFGYTGNGSVTLGQLKKAVDNKIYQVYYKYPYPNSTITKLHCILNPDSLDIACNYTLNYLNTGNMNTAGLPNNEITWNLGPLVGSPCDTICFTPPVINTNEAAICRGDSIFLYGAYRYESGTYGDTLHNYKGCDSIIHQTLLTVYDVNITLTQNNNTLYAQQQDNVTYQWYNCEDNTPISGATNATYTATQNGLYYVQFTDAHGCTFKSACYAVTGVGVSEIISGAEISIFPNPAQELIHISSPVALHKVQLFDVLGREVLQLHSTGNSLSISTDNLTNGVYYLRVNQYARAYKVIVQK